MTEPIPSLELDFYSDSVIKNPYPYYQQLRNTGPVVYLAKNNLYALSRYDEVSQVLRDPLHFVSSKGVSPQDKVNSILVGSTLNSDPPEHDETRAITSAPLLPGALSEIEPRIRAASEGLIHDLCLRGEFDAIADFAQYLPLTIVAELVGLPDAGRDNMLKWASATFNLFGTENERSEASFADLKELREFLLEYGQPEKLKPGGLAKRIFEVGPGQGFSLEKCAQLMRDYIAPSLDTTISTTGQLVKLFADNPEQWTRLRENPEWVGNAVEEAVRLSTPIRAFTRYVVEDSVIGGVTVPADARVLVIYASANRDERKYENPDKFDISRDVHDHIGFGQGVHMCMGMHLARLEISSLIESLIPRVKHFVLTGEPEVAMNNTIRAFSSMPVKLELDNAFHHVEETYTQQLKGNSSWLKLKVKSRELTAQSVIALELQSLDNTELPSYEAGAHVDVQIREGLVRQYSLTGNPNDRSNYRLGILRDENSRGGSVAIHDRIKAGDTVKIGYPRNNFSLVDHAEHTLLFAGGIGITPMLSMAYQLEQQGRSFELHYCAKTDNHLAYRSELLAFGGRVHFHTDDGINEQRLKTADVLSEVSAERHLYVCGPAGFMDHITSIAEQCGWSSSCIHLERFAAEIDTNGAPFTVVAKKSGRKFDVNPGETIVDGLLAQGIEVPMSCQSGVCGTCLVQVLDGTPDHRDFVQTDFEKASNKRITVCCSRSRTKQLILNI